MISLMCNDGDDVENFRLMRLLIITCNFMVECKATLHTQIECINYDYSETRKQRLLSELKRNGLDYNYEQIEPVVDLLYKNRVILSIMMVKINKIIRKIIRNKYFKNEINLMVK